jgi:ferredoxin-NADP reductase
MVLRPAPPPAGNRYKAVLLISGGIGITPIQALFNELLRQASEGRPLRRLALVWSVRDKYMVDR